MSRQPWIRSLPVITEQSTPARAELRATPCAGSGSRSWALGAGLAALAAVALIVVGTRSHSNALAVGDLAAEITVCPSGCDHATLAAAVAAAAENDTIAIGEGEYAGRVSLEKKLTLRGAGAGKTTLLGGGGGAVLEVRARGKVNIEALSITGGTGVLIDGDRYGGGIYILHDDAKVTVERCRIADNVAMRDGGGIYLDAGELTVLDSTIEDNLAGESGGGVYVDENTTASIERTIIRSNRAVFESDPGSRLSSGGGIANRGDVSLIDVDFLENSAQSFGGGILNRARGELIIKSSTIEASSTEEGAGIYNSAVLSVEDSRIRDNVGSREGGGLHNLGTADLVRVELDGNRAASGAALYTRKGGAPRQDGELNVHSAIIVGNIATGKGGGLMVGPEGVANLGSVTIARNVAGTGPAVAEQGGRVEINDSTIAENAMEPPPAAPSDGSALNATATSALRLGGVLLHNPGLRNCNERLASLGHNLDSDGSCELTRPGDIQPREAGLGELGLHGGSLLLYALLPDSPAIDAGHPIRCPDTDQRGFARPVDGDGDGEATCDIGAYEFGASADGAPTPGPTGSTPPSATPPVEGTPTPGGARPIYLPRASAGE